MDMPSWMPVIIYALCLMAFLGVYAYRRMDDSIGRQPFVMLVFLTAFMLLTDLISRCYIYEGFSHLLVAGSTAITFMMLPAIGAEWYQYLRSVFTAEERAKMRYLDFIINFIAAFGIIAVLLSPVTSWVYSFDDAGVYHRGPFFVVPAVTLFLIMIIAVAFMLVNVRSLGRSSIFTLSLFPIPALVGAFMSMLFPDIPWVPLGVSIAMVVLFANIQNTGMGRDYLTGLFNRKKLEELLEESIDRAQSGHRFAAIMMDLDEFKVVNDTLGHAVGDIALAETARLLKRSVRSGDAVARFGGDEFFVLLNVENEADLHEVIERIEVEEEQFDREERPYSIRLSKGYDFYDPDTFSSISEFEKHLDSLMYENKQRRRALRAAQAASENTEIFTAENRRRV